MGRSTSYWGGADGTYLFASVFSRSPTPDGKARSISSFACARRSRHVALRARETAARTTRFTCSTWTRPAHRGRDPVVALKSISLARRAAARVPEAQGGGFRFAAAQLYSSNSLLPTMAARRRKIRCVRSAMPTSGEIPRRFSPVDIDTAAGLTLVRDSAGGSGVGAYVAPSKACPRKPERVAGSVAPPFSSEVVWRPGATVSVPLAVFMALSHYPLCPARGSIHSIDIASSRHPSYPVYRLSAACSAW